MRSEPSCILCKDYRPLTLILKYILSKIDCNFTVAIDELLFIQTIYVKCMTYLSHYFIILDTVLYFARIVN